MKFFPKIIGQNDKDYPFQNLKKYMAKHIYDLFVQRIILLFSCQHTMFVVDLRV